MTFFENRDLENILVGVDEIASPFRWFVLDGKTFLIFLWIALLLTKLGAGLFGAAI